VERDVRGIRIENRGDTFNVLPLPVSLNTLLRDFRFSVRTEAETGTGPQLVVSAPLVETQEPASEGYQAGRSGTLTRRRLPRRPRESVPATWSA
jgi:hypothetical protein